MQEGLFAATHLTEKKLCCGRPCDLISTITGLSQMENDRGGQFRVSCYSRTCGYRKTAGGLLLSNLGCSRMSRGDQANLDP